MNEFRSISIGKPNIDIELVSADQFTFTQLTNAYNQTRAEYLVPMPMNERKLREYVHNYDIDLQQSVVAVKNNEILGLAMLGVRGDNTWITRLGVIPNGRQKGVGRKLTDKLISNSQKIGAIKIILEVIKTNTPAEMLFYSCGFQMLRDLLVVRRPAKPISSIVFGSDVEALGHEDALKLLESRTDTPSWVTGTASMHNAGNLAALYATLPSGGKGWLVYQNTAVQLGRLVITIEAGDPDDVTKALLENLHWRHSMQDTITENIPADAPYWPAMKEAGYIVSFSRTEMYLPLS